MNIPPAITLCYKWDPRTWSGYRLLIDPQDTPHPYHVQDWENRHIALNWDCDSLEQAVDRLGHLFELDEARELCRLRDHLDLARRQVA